MRDRFRQISLNDDLPVPDLNPNFMAKINVCQDDTSSIVHDFEYI